jgi:hypothetical protein
MWASLSSPLVLRGGVGGLEFIFEHITISSHRMWCWFKKHPPAYEGKVLIKHSLVVLK